jgi:glycosyltransferase involved in cell wall biosynthesis
LQKKRRKINFVVPGAVIEQRRDHKVVLDAFEHLFTKYKDKISLCLLGKSTGSYGKQILNRCQVLKNQGFDVSYFEKFVPEEIYDRTLNEANVVIAPVKLNTTSLGTWIETFGISKASGAVFEAIQYAKPLVLPEKFNLMNELSNSSIKYSDYLDLEDKLTNIIEDEKILSSLEENAIENSKKISFSSYKKYFEDNLLNKI